MKSTYRKGRINMTEQLYECSECRHKCTLDDMGADMTYNHESDGDEWWSNWICPKCKIWGTDPENRHVGSGDSELWQKVEPHIKERKSKMKILLLPLFLLTACQGMELSPEVMATSYHTRETTPAGKPYNEENWGGGLHITTKSEGWRYGGRALTYKNSIDRHSALAVGTVDYCFDNKPWVICPGVMAGGVTGYGDHIRPIAAPTIELGYGRASIVLTAFPTSDFSAGVVSGWLKFKLLTW